MPLFFGNNVAPKGQQILLNEPAPSEKGTSSKHISSSHHEQDPKGTVIKLPKHCVKLEKKLAEGGFAVVYLASDRQGHRYALKRQFINDDQRQLEACKRESKIVMALGCHKNIVTYVDHSITLTKSTGVYDYMLLTPFYRSSVLQLMNERLSANQWLTTGEILAIFCDMCEAVARLHHSQTPVIHRDLKVENILIDERRRQPSVYVLCDFGSATTKVLSTETHQHSFVEDEVQRYTTLSYRAPEMLDLYSGWPLGTKLDIWAMGVMLYKLCYFALPFEESALAIQNGKFTYPTVPTQSDDLKILIEYLLQKDVSKRPDIYQTSCVAFQLANRNCPVPNLNKVPKMTLAQLRFLFRGIKCDVVESTTESPLFEAVLSPIGRTPLTTSVNPRLRPKPLTKSASQQSKVLSPTTPYASVKHEDRVLVNQAAVDSPASFINERSGVTSGKIHHEFLEQHKPITYRKQHRRNASDPSSIAVMRSSAFKPYSTSAVLGVESLTATVDILKTDTHDGAFRMTFNGEVYPLQVPPDWNPFADAPFNGTRQIPSKLAAIIGNGNKQSTKAPHGISENDDNETPIDFENPFAGAPFYSVKQGKSRLSDAKKRSIGDIAVSAESTDQIDSTSVLIINSTRVVPESAELLPEDEECNIEDRVQLHTTGLFSYEHIDSVGDDASSDSRFAEDGDNTEEEDTKDEDDDNTSHLMSISSNHESDDEVADVPLLEDDELCEARLNGEQNPTAIQESTASSQQILENAATPVKMISGGQKSTVDTKNYADVKSFLELQPSHTEQPAAKVFSPVSHVVTVIATTPSTVVISPPCNTMPSVVAPQEQSKFVHQHNRAASYAGGMSGETSQPVHRNHNPFIDYTTKHIALKIDDNRVSSRKPNMVPLISKQVEVRRVTRTEAPKSDFVDYTAKKGPVDECSDRSEETDDSGAEMCTSSTAESKKRTKRKEKKTKLNTFEKQQHLRLTPDVLHAKRSHHRGPISAAKAAALDGSSFVNSSFQGEDAEQQQERSTR